MLPNITQNFGSFGSGEEQQVEDDHYIRPMDKLSENFKYANWQNPYNFNYALKASDNKFNRGMLEAKKGTTTLAFKTKHGLVIAVDSRASMGNFEASNDVRKVVECGPHFLATMAGTAADCQYFLPYVKMEARLFELQYGEQMSVVAAAKRLATIAFQYAGQG